MLSNSRFLIQKRSLPMWWSFVSPTLRSFASAQLAKNQLKTKIIVKNIPTAWNRTQIATQFGVVGSIQAVNMIKNRQDQNVGKAIIEFQNENQVKEAIRKFDNKDIDNQKVSVSPYVDQNSNEVQETAMPLNTMMSRRVYLMNLPLDTSELEIEAFCKQFATVDKVVLPKQTDGLSKGYAFVFVQNAQDVDKLIEFTDGQSIRNNQITAKSSLGGLEQNNDDKFNRNLNLDPQKDAEKLGRYQNYVKHMINQELNFPMRMNESDQIFHSAHLRQVKRVQQRENLGYAQAQYQVLHMQQEIKLPNEPGYQQYIQTLREQIRYNNEIKTKKIQEDKDLKEQYPKTYMLSKSAQLLDQKEGKSEFEIYSGFSETIFSSPPVRKRFSEARKYNLDEM